MRRRFGRGRRGRSGADKATVIDAEKWLARIASGGVAGVSELEPVEAEDVPSDFAVLGRGEGEGGAPVLVGVSPRDGSDAALAVIAHARRLAAGDGFDGEVVAVAPQWGIGARSRLALLGEPPFAFRAVAAPALGEDDEVEAPRLPAPAAWPASRAAAALESAEARDLFLRALSALEGLAAKHGGAVRPGPEGAELVLLSRRAAVLAARNGDLVLEMLLPERSTATLARDRLAAAMDRLEGQLRKRLNDRRVKGGDEGTRALALPALAEVAGLRDPAAWPLAGSDPEVIDVVGLDAEGRPVVGAIRSRLGLAQLAGVLDAALALRPALPLLFADATPPVRLGELRLALAAGEIDAAVLHGLEGLVLGHALFDLHTRRGGAPEVVLRGEKAGAAPQPAEREGAGRRRRRRPRRAPAEGGDGAAPRAAAATGAAAAPVGEVEEMSLFDLDDEGRSDTSEEDEAPRGRRRRRGRRRSRRPASEEPLSAPPVEPAAESEESVEDLLAEDADLDPGAGLSPLGDDVDAEELPGDEVELVGDDDEEEAGEEDWATEREARRRARLAKLDPEPEPEVAPKPPRRRSAIVVHADRDSVLAGILLARDIRQIEGFWVYPQADLMTFFRGVATDLRPDTPIQLVGFVARPARDAIQAAALYRGRLFWYDHHDWPPEDLESLRATIGPECVGIEPGGGSSVPAVLETRERRSRFSDKLVELAMGRFSQHDYERWGRLWWQRLGEIAARSGEQRRAIDPLLSGRPSELAREAARQPQPAPPEEVAYVSGRDFRVVHFGGFSMVVVPVPEGLDLHLAARVARERFDARLSLAHAEGSDLIVLSADEARGRHALDLSAMVGHLAAKHEWIEQLRDEDQVARVRVRDLALRPERLDEVVAEVAMGRSILEG